MEEAKTDSSLSDSPALLPLLHEFKDNVEKVRGFAKLLTQRIKNKELPTHSGISFIEVKFHLLLQYCLNLSLFLLIKLEGRLCALLLFPVLAQFVFLSAGRSIQNRPVIMHLIEIRTILEKLKSVDQKLHYEIQKMTKTATLHHASSLVNPHSPFAAAASSSLDPLSFRPHLDSLLKSGADDVEGGDEMNAAGGSKDKEDEEDDGIYHPPMMEAVPYHGDERKQEKDARKPERLMEQARHSSMVQQLRQELSDRPEEIQEGLAYYFHHSLLFSLFGFLLAAFFCTVLSFLPSLPFLILLSSLSLAVSFLFCLCC